MKFDENLAAIHSYLCADGYVIRNPLTQKNIYYYIGFRNTNIILLKDFQKKFEDYFEIKPRLIPGERCVVQKKELYFKLINEFESFYSKDWRMPKLNKRLFKIWLRAFFDCEAWVYCKSHQNRMIGLDSINNLGLNQIKDVLESMGIKCIKKIIKNGYMFRILIYGKDNLRKFKEEIGFLHPDKKFKLNKVIDDFMDYNWHIKKDRELIKKLMLEKAKAKKPYLIIVISRERENLDNLSEYLESLFFIKDIKINECINGLGTKYFQLNINKKDEVLKLINNKLINETQLNRIDKNKIGFKNVQRKIEKN